MRTLYLHIGTEKTGTSTLQQVLADNADILAARGIHHLQSAGKTNSRMLPAYCLDDGHFDDFFLDRRILDQAGKAAFKARFHKALSEELDSLSPNIHSVVASSEHFHSRITNAKSVARVAELLSPWFDQIYILCYLREQVATCTSNYSTQIKSGITKSFHDFVDVCNPQNIYYNYDNMLANWRTVFGADAMRVRLFDRAFLDEGDLVTDFFNLIEQGLATALRPVETSANQSLDPFGEILGRAINIAVPRHLPNGAINARRARAIRVLSSQFPGTGLTFPEDVAREVYESFRASNQKVNADYFGGNGDLFAFRPPSEQSASVSDQDADRIAEVIATLSGDPALMSDATANPLRDAALALESSNPELAYRLMKLAALFRPEGPVILKKLKEYRQALSDPD
jgi:hypothetical protein